MFKLFKTLMDHHGLKLNPTSIALLGVFFGALMVATFHYIFNGCRHSLSSNHTQQRNTPESTTTVTVPAASRYSKECSDDTCSVCFSEFKDGEEIRVLPECFHVFHVACIDTWLISHSNCPLCRASTGITVPPPRNGNDVVVRTTPEYSNSGDRIVNPSWNPI